MAETNNKFMSVHYQLYTVVDGEDVLEEQTSREHPFEFVTGFGVSMEGFEAQVSKMEKGTPFDFVLTPQEAFGEYDPEGVHKLSRDVFSINGHFDHDNIQPGAVITLLDAEEHPFLARIKKVEADGVTIDTNHPLAGKTLHFTGLVLENREATLQEMHEMATKLSGEGCGCGCDDCGGHDHQHGGGCGCGHCH